MKEIHIVTMGSENSWSMLQFAFHDINEAEKFRDYIDTNKGGSRTMSTIHSLRVYDAAIQLMKQEAK